MCICWKVSVLTHWLHRDYLRCKIFKTRETKYILMNLLSSSYNLQNFYTKEYFPYSNFSIPSLLFLWIKIWFAFLIKIKMISRLFCSSNEGIRETACKCIPQVLRCAREDSEKRSSLLKEIIKQLRDVMDCEYETSLLIVELECMNVCISDGGEFLNDMEFEFLCN